MPAEFDYAGRPELYYAGFDRKVYAESPRSRTRCGRLPHINRHGVFRS